ncbi:MAG: PBP1A family penicillin-binding protein [Pyrinomonadaceae bacterium]|nr:PBP1A family penicillin-binding protein [Pyrinomonadaceae bacterium]MBP9110765.1 PBP1A family penicillin-binding protein [Pyrinomonadaceae bacterium]
MQDKLPDKTSRSKMPPKGWVKSRRASSYQAPPDSRSKRVLRKVFNVWTLAIAGILLVAGFLTLTYFWFEFSDRIDRRLLSGEVFTASAGIYSAPKTLKVGEAINAQGLIEYLKSAGYIERNNQADASRSRYVFENDVLGIEPGLTGSIDGKKVFPSLSIKFSKDGKTVAAIGDRDSNTQPNEAKLEPRILSSIAAEGDGRRKTVTFNDIPPHLVKAITVTEDRAFFEHYGINLRGIARAFWRRYESDENSPISNQGGSSITQQLVKNLLLTRDQTWERKITEAYMSVILETRLTKQEIFTLYANQIYLGQQSGVSIYGVGEASNAYFGKDVSQLTLPEAAFLAGIIRSPNRYNPYKNPERVQERRNQVLESMVEAGELDAGKLAQVRTEPIQLRQISNTKDLQGMPYFSQFAIEELPKIISDPEALQHLRVYTSIDPDLQRIAYETVNKRLAALDKYFPKKAPGSLNAALVAIRPKTGEIVAMVGGRDYLANQFNRATDAQRQPGSVFKPFVYAAAINTAYDSSSRQFTTATVFKDEKKTFTYGSESYTPGNFGDFFSNKETTLRDALVKSKNVITVDIAMSLNVGKVMNFANKAGMPKVDKAYPSMALGTSEATPLQVATAYTMFANLGDRVLPTPITRVTGGDGRTTVAPAPDRKNVVRPDVAYIMDDMMKDVVNRGTAAQLQGWGFRNVAGKTAFAGKTGTSRDGWFAGFTPEIVCVVYVGFDNGDDLGMKGSDSAMPVWADFMKEALRLHPEWNGDWTMPANLRKAEIDIRSGALIRELDALAEASPSATPSPTPKQITDSTDPYYEDPVIEPKEVFLTNVPAEFRRVEIFVVGTVPNRQLIPMNEDIPLDDAPPQPKAAASATPVTETWQDAQPDGSAPDGGPGKRENRPSATGSGETTVMVCPVSGQRATARCPDKESRSFKKGAEPKDFCTFHR